jgi:anaerobic selenocysteine-containing dehydrogenase
MTKDAENPSRRTFLRRSAMAAVMAGTAVAPKSVSAAQAPVRKLTKEEAGYENHPNGPYRCGICANFIAPNDCKVVRGPVSPSGWCRHFAVIDE